MRLDIKPEKVYPMKLNKTAVIEPQNVNKLLTKKAYTHVQLYIGHAHSGKLYLCWNIVYDT